VAGCFIGCCWGIGGRAAGQCADRHDGHHLGQFSRRGIRVAATVGIFFRLYIRPHKSRAA